jgi:hypothetical protein
MERKVRKTMKSLLSDTGMTEWEMRGSREMLEKVGAITCTYLRLEHTLEFSVSLSRLDELCKDYEQKGVEASEETSDAHPRKHQMPPEETSDRHPMKPQIDHYLENKIETGETEIVVDLVQNILPWMEKIFRSSPRCHDLAWPKIKYPKDFQITDDRVGREIFRRAWIEEVGTSENPNPFEFLKRMKDEYPSQRSSRSGGNGNGSHHKTVSEIWLEKHADEVAAEQGK